MVENMHVAKQERGRGQSNKMRHNIGIGLIVLMVALVFILNGVFILNWNKECSPPTTLIKLQTQQFTSTAGTIIAAQIKNRTNAIVNAEIISTLLKNSDPFSAPLTNKPDWSYPHTHWMPDFFEYVYTKYVKPNQGHIEFYLEVGSFKAGSIARMADLLKSHYSEHQEWKRTSLVCMDPFTGDVNMWEWNGQKNKWGHDFLSTADNGRPQMFETFMANVVDKGHQDIILPLVVGGLVGMKLVDRLHKNGRISRLPNIIYLDSAHQKDETYLELNQAWLILRDCGAIIGDDWNWAAVRKDVTRFARDMKLSELPLFHGFSKQPVPGVMLHSKQWAIIKSKGGNDKCKYEKNGTW